MIVVNVDLLSAVTGETTSLNRVVIANVSGGGRRRDYLVRSFRKGYDPVQHGLSGGVNRTGKVLGHPADSVSVLTLLRKSLEEMGY